MAEPLPTPQTEWPSPEGRPAPTSEAQPVSWWQRNRLALILLLPLAAAAALLSSYPLFVLYLPNHFVRAQRGAPSVLFRDSFKDVGPDRPPRWYGREVQISLRSLRQAPTFEGEKAAKNATLWIVGLEFQAKPQEMLKGCHIVLVDQQGRLYDDINGKSGWPENGTGCVPKDTPGPELDFFGKLDTGGEARPPVWTVYRTVAMPERRIPQAVRVLWSPPRYAELRVGRQ